MPSVDSARPIQPGPAKPHLTCTEFVHLQGISSRLTAIRDPIRDLTRSSTIATPDDPQPDQAHALKLDKLHSHILQQLDLAESLIHQYTSALANIASDEQRPESHHHRTSAPQASSASGATERNITTAWASSPITVSYAVPVNEVYMRLSKQQRAVMDERVPLIPRRDMSVGSSQLGSVLELVQSLFRSSAREGTATELCKSLDTIPPGIMAYAISASASHLFQKLTPDSILEGAKFMHGSFKDHTSFIARFVESSVLLSAQAKMRSRRVEWWVTVAYLLRELGDYESLNGVICAISGSVVNRMSETWESVPASCKAAIKYIMESVLAPHQNYSSYNIELQERIAKISQPAESQSGLTEQISLDFDKAVAHAAIDEYVYSPVYLKGCASLPTPSTIVPIYLQHTTANSQSRWRWISHLPFSATSVAYAAAAVASVSPNASSKATAFIKRGSRRSSAAENSSNPYHPCHSCRIGAPLVDLHLAVHLATTLLFCEPWMPHEYIFRLSDMRESRSSHLPPAKPHTLATMAKAKAYASSSPTQSTTSKGSERAIEAPWLGTPPPQGLTTPCSPSPDNDGAPDAYVRFLGTRQGYMRSAGAGHQHHSKSPYTTSNSTRSSLQAAGVLPSLPPLPSNAVPPPLPTANMPTDISPLAADLAKMGIPPSHLPSSMMPPPLPSQPMPSFQPSSHIPPNFEQRALPPNSPYATEHMSAEALMLLNFDKAQESAHLIAINKQAHVGTKHVHSMI
ncbi:hypothetical protein DL89DRAFT_266426 [Linderina pennispora]|uniref:Ras-GEF domain-containing protein n=1 Tax=Linderina pennispora TaxID=61395 RepID=A0A1Y1WE17_9FUNG|nr:uncharacterized protein DL89DRAFT_266426 [Linderina pennispora]ORX71424.1 hypothetical protein DL89DRAFT_266426 [Linderina pennispora]